MNIRKLLDGAAQPPGGNQDITIQDKIDKKKHSTNRVNPEKIICLFDQYAPPARELRHQLGYIADRLEQAAVTSDDLFHEVDHIRDDIKGLLLTYESVGEISRLERDCYLRLFNMEVAA